VFELVWAVYFDAGVPPVRLYKRSIHSNMALASSGEPQKGPAMASGSTVVVTRRGLLAASGAVAVAAVGDSLDVKPASADVPASARFDLTQPSYDLFRNKSLAQQTVMQMLGRLRHGPLRLDQLGPYRPMMNSIRALSSASPTVPIEASMRPEHHCPQATARLRTS
jgi:hypothetical protein